MMDDGAEENEGSREGGLRNMGWKNWLRNDGEEKV